MSAPGPFHAKQSAAGLIAALQKDPDRPLSAMLEIADRCNEVCVHCYQVQGQKGEMTTEQVCRVLDELAEMGVFLLTISGGEPTLRHDFFEILAYARKLKFAIKLYTNGLNMTDEMAERIHAHAVLEVQISLYSHRAEVHDWVTRVPGSFEKTVAGANALLARGVKVVLKTPIMTINEAELDEYVAFVTGLGADYIIDPHLDPREDGDRTPERLHIDQARHLEVMQRPGLLPEPDLADRTPDLDKKLCGACRGHVHVEANGDIRPCTQMGVSVGDATREGVKRAWDENQTALTLRDVRWRDIHGCRDCDLQPWCDRCFANAYTQAGDALAPYESACRAAAVQYEHHRGEAITLREGDVERRGTALGPYRRVDAHVFETIEDQLTPEDRARAVDWSWVRRPGGAVAAEGGRVGPGDLVQLRRPGRRVTKLEKIPSYKVQEGPDST